MARTTILICDDEMGVRDSLRIMLGREYRLAYATTGEAAVEYLKTHSPALVILDIKMPRMSGLEVLRVIKQLKPRVRVLMITGYESSDVASQAVQLGVDGYLTKPFDGPQVKAQIRALVGATSP